jgi:hypothetical protein
MIKSIRPFIGSKNFDESRQFYADLGFTESVIDPKISYFFMDKCGFYLQNYFSKEWVHNTMVFMEVEDLDEWLTRFKSLELPKKYKGVKLSEIVVNDWGSEFFLHDPAGVLWHFGFFNG